jgi:hypothetical protein
MQSNILPRKPRRFDRRLYITRTLRAWSPALGFRQAYFLGLARFGSTDTDRANAASRLIPANRAILATS